MDEVEEYIKLILSNFYDNKENLNLDISINWIWVVYNEKGTINFVEITIPLD